MISHSLVQPHAMEPAGLLAQSLQARARGLDALAHERIEQARAQAAGPLETAQVLLVQGLLAQDIGAVDRAERLYRRAEGIATRFGDPKLRLRAGAHLGELYRTQGRYLEAGQVLEPALASCDAAVRAAHPMEAAQVYNELGMLGKYTGTFDRAADYYRQALIVLGNALGPDHPDLATVWHNIGGLAHARGDHRAAEEPARRAVELRERALGPDHRLVAADLAALAPILLELGKTEEAHRLLHQALTVFRQTVGEDHYDTAAALHNLGALAHRQGHRPAARKHFQQALSIKERLLGPRHPALASTLAALALLHRLDGDHATARAFYQQAHTLLTGTVEPGHPILTTVQTALADQMFDATDGDGCGARAGHHGLRGSEGKV